MMPTTGVPQINRPKPKSDKPVLWLNWLANLIEYVWEIYLRLFPENIALEGLYNRVGVKRIKTGFCLAK